MIDRLDEIRERWLAPGAPRGSEEIAWLVAEVDRLREALYEIEAEAQIATAPTLADVKAKGFVMDGSAPQGGDSE